MKYHRKLLATYLIGLLVLLLLPLSGPEVQILAIKIDKWLHLLIFGGLAMLIRWNLRASARATLVSAAIAVVIALMIEIVQGLTKYRSADSWDLVAGLGGAIPGAMLMSRVMSSPAPDKLFGIVVSILGFLICSVSALADFFKTGSSNEFGLFQIAGTILGSCVLLSGVWVCYRAMHIAK